MRCWLLIAVFCYSELQAQLTTGMEQQWENQAGLENDAMENSEWLEQMQLLLRHPVPINTATEEELQQLAWLHPLQIQQLLQYRKLLGAFIDKYELQAIPGWDVETVRMVLPFITLHQPERLSFRQMFTMGEHQLLARASMILQQQAGYESNRPGGYLGSRQHLMAHYRFQYKNELYIGLTADKDAGERMFRQFPPFDFQSFHWYLRRKGFVRTIAVGDYTLNLGQGLVHWQSFGFKKSGDVLSIKRQAAQILPYRSSGEFYFNRGAAITVERKKMSGSMFFSLRNLDARTDSDGVEKVVTGYVTTGLHRTEAETGNRATLRQLLYGGSILFKTAQSRLGLQAVSHGFSLPWRKKAEPYQAFSINGRQWFNASLDYSTTIKNFHLFGEAATDRNGSLAWVHGLLISLHKNADLSLLQRRIGMRYQAVSGNAFTEQTLPSNEHGFFAGLRIRFSSRLQFDAYHDIYHFPWLRFRVDGPSNGKDLMVQLRYQPDRKTECYARFRSEEKGLNTLNAPAVMPHVAAKRKTSVRIHTAWSCGPHVQLKCRMESVWYDPGGEASEQGFLFYAEGSFDAALPLSGNLRLQYFETDGFNSRIYAYESDVLYGFSIPAVSDKGMRLYVNFSYDVSSKIKCWFRFSQTVYSNISATGTGLNLIDGKKVSDIKFQASYRF